MLIYTFWVICLLLFGQKSTSSDEPYHFNNHLRLIIIIPAMNEAGVIRKTITRFVGETAELPNISMAIIDDGSTDGTGAVARQTIAKYNCQNRIQVLIRTKPNAQQGKGSALNWAYHQLVNPTQMRHRDLAQTIIGVLDADAYMTQQGYEQVLANFANHPQIDLLQTRVGMITIRNWLQLFQDIEFRVINDWIQNTRNLIHNAAASGNGQFIRTSSIRSDNPWGNALLEDFEFSTRFLLRGKHTYYASNIVVYQEAIAKIFPFIRQRARWTQGGLDCLFSYWPRILRNSRINFLSKMEMTFYMFIPFITLVSGLAGLYVLVYVTAHIMTCYPVVISLVFLNCIINNIIIADYRKTANLNWFISLISIIFLGIYNYLLYPAIVIAFYKKIRGQHGWAKTAHGSKDVA